jgi:hypothetical protein
VAEEDSSRQFLFGLDKLSIKLRRKGDKELMQVVATRIKQEPEGPAQSCRN